MRRAIPLLCLMILLASVSVVAYNCPEGYGLCENTSDMDVRFSQNTSDITFVNPHESSKYLLFGSRTQWWKDDFNATQIDSKDPSDRLKNGNKVDLVEGYINNSNTYYNLTEKGIKLNIEFNTKADLPALPESYNYSELNLEFNFYLETNLDVVAGVNYWDGVSQVETKFVAFYKNGFPVITMPVPYGVDSSGSKTYFSYKLAKYQGYETLSLVVPYSWLNTSSYPIRIDPSAVSGCSENTTTVLCRDGTFSGNFIDTNKSILIINATVGNSGGSLIRLNTSNGSIDVINSTLQGDGVDSVSGTQVGEGDFFGSENITFLNVNLLADGGNGFTDEIGDVGSVDFRTPENVIIIGSTIDSRGGSGGGATAGSTSGGKSTFFVNASNFLVSGSNFNSNGGGGGAGDSGGSGGNSNITLIISNSFNFTSSSWLSSAGGGPNGDTGFNGGTGGKTVHTISVGNDLVWQNSSITFKGGPGGSATNNGHGGAAGNSNLEFNVGDLFWLQNITADVQAGDGGACVGAGFVSGNGGTTNFNTNAKTAFFNSTTIDFGAGLVGSSTGCIAGSNGVSKADHHMSQEWYTKDSSLLSTNSQSGFPKINSTNPDFIFVGLANTTYSETHNIFCVGNDLILGWDGSPALVLQDPSCVFNQTTLTIAQYGAPFNRPLVTKPDFFPNNFVNPQNLSASTNLTTKFGENATVAYNWSINGVQQRFFNIDTTNGSKTNDTIQFQIKEGDKINVTVKANNASGVGLPRIREFTFVLDNSVTVPVFDSDPFTPGTVTAFTNLSTFDGGQALVFFNWTTSGSTIRYFNVSGFNGTTINDSLPFNTSFVDGQNFTVFVNSFDDNFFVSKKTNATTTYSNIGKNVVVNFSSAVPPETPTGFLLTLNHTGTTINSITGNLNYDGSPFGGIGSVGTNTSTLSTNITTPSITTTSEIKSFNYTYTIGYPGGINLDYSTQNFNQTITGIDLGACPFGDATILNFTIKDQTTNALLNASLNGNFTVDSASFSINFGTNSTHELCANLSGATQLSLSYTVNFDAPGFFAESYSVQNFNWNGTEGLVDLFLANQSTHNVVTFTVLDDSFAGIDNALLKIRKFTNGTFTLVTVANVQNGLAQAALELLTQDYSLILEKGGVDFDDNINPRKFTTTDVTLFYNLAGVSLSGYFDDLKTTKSLSYDNSTDIVSFTWNNPDGTIVKACVEGFKMTGAGLLEQFSTCDSKVSSASGTITQTLGKVEGNDYVIYGHIGDASSLSTLYVDATNAFATFGLMAPFASFLLIIAIALGIFGGQPTSLVIGSLIGLVSVFLLGISGLGWATVTAISVIGIASIALGRSVR